VRKHSFGVFAGDDFAQALQAGATNVRDTSEFAEQSLRSFWPDAGNFEQGGRGLSFASALTVEGYGEAMRFVPDLLNEMKNWRVAVESDWFVFLAVDVENFFFLGNAGERLVDDLERVESLGGGVELADTAVDQD